MKITVVIHCHLDDHPIRFAQAVLEAGHEIPLIFFYQEAVRHADPDQSQRQLVEWQHLRRQWGLRLAICISAASRRGLLDETQSAGTSTHVAEGFEVAGLGQLVGAMAESDRVVTFAT